MDEEGGGFLWEVPNRLARSDNSFCAIESSDDTCKRWVVNKLEISEATKVKVLYTIVPILDNSIIAVKKATLK